MDDWTSAYIFVGFIIPLAYVTSAICGIIMQRRAASRAAEIQQRQEDMYEAYWYAWRDTGTAATAASCLYETYGTKELVDIGNQQLAQRKQEPQWVSRAHHTSEIDRRS